jgi:AcrR family transcriptional regulator
LPEGDRPPVGLRERKKAKTRATIREHAMRLFHEQGYAATTVEQIAEAAEVSPSTFFRYFPTKEDVVLIDDIDPIVLKALHEQPPEVGPVEAVRAAIHTAFEQLSGEEWEQERARHRLVMSVPELRSALLDEFARTITMLTSALAERLGRSADDFAVRTFSGALLGTVTAAVLPVLDDPDADLLALLDAALARMEAGFPL